MYVSPLKGLVVEAANLTFNDEYPVVELTTGGEQVDLRGLRFGIEYPATELMYPSVWVTWEPQGPMKTAGIDHKEFVEVEGGFLEVRRWLFAGYVSFTIVALTSFERDLIYDELSKAMAFGQINPVWKAFRDRIEQDPYLDVQFDWDEIEQRGMPETPGTPWETMDVVYEATLAMECTGEFAMTAEGAILVPLNAIDVVPRRVDEADPDPSW